MTCRDVLDLVEPIAAGDMSVDDVLRAHLETCPRCASALASARRLEAALLARPKPDASPNFTAAVLTRIRRDRWQSEQRIDRLFNLAVAAALLLIVGGVVALLNVRVVLASAARGWDFAGTLLRDVTVQAVPTIGMYVAAFGLLVSALAMWWWAERRLSL